MPAMPPNSRKPPLNPPNNIRQRINKPAACNQVSAGSPKSGGKSAFHKYMVTVLKTATAPLIHTKINSLENLCIINSLAMQTSRRVKYCMFCDFFSCAAHRAFTFLSQSLGAFLALRAKNRAIRSNSSQAPVRLLRGFRYYPLRAFGRATKLCMRSIHNFATSPCSLKA
jgi:hypothetical protein